MDADKFRLEVEIDQKLADYADDIAQDAAPPDTERAIGLDFLFVVGTYALFLWLKQHLEYQRGLEEAELRRLMEQEIHHFVQMGHSREEALAAVLAVSKAVAHRPPDDAVLRAGLALLKGPSNQ